MEVQAIKKKTTKNNTALNPCYSCGGMHFRNNFPFKTKKNVSFVRKQIMISACGKIKSKKNYFHPKRIDFVKVSLATWKKKNTMNRTFIRVCMNNKSMTLQLDMSLILV